MLHDRGDRAIRSRNSFLVPYDEHVHFVVVPQQEKSLANAFGEAHRRYTRMRNFAEGVRGYLFQGRFGSCVLDERHLIAAARYVELNPVRAMLVKLPVGRSVVKCGVSCKDAGWGSAGQGQDFERACKGLAGISSSRRKQGERPRLATRTGLPAGH